MNTLLTVLLITEVVLAFIYRHQRRSKQKANLLIEESAADAVEEVSVPVMEASVPVTETVAAADEIQVPAAIRRVSTLIRKPTVVTVTGVRKYPDKAARKARREELADRYQQRGIRYTRRCSQRVSANTLRARRANFAQQHGAKRARTP